MSPTIVLYKCNDPNWERVDPEADSNVTVKSSSFMYFENGLDGVLKARQGAEALIAANPEISSLLRGVILASTFATIDRKEKYFLEIEAKKKKKSKKMSLLLLRPKKKMRRENINNNAITRDDTPIFDAIEETNRMKHTSNKGILALLDLHIPLLFCIFNYLGETQDELRNLILVSKQVYQICYGSYGRPGIEWKIIPSFEISTLQNEVFGGVGSIETLLINLYHHSLNTETKNKLQFYRHMRVNDLQKFHGRNISEDIIRHIKMNIRMSGITTLDISIPLPTMQIRECCLLTCILPYIVPNLLELHSSNLSMRDMSLEDFSKNCHFLETITSNNSTDISLNGFAMSFSNNLRGIYMDNSVFSVYSNTDMQEFSDLVNHERSFIFSHCCKSLERVSVRNAKYCDGKITQNALIKFVRNAPSSMRWFRSDLSQDNITSCVYPVEKHTLYHHAQ
jgi:hypothetical protein